MAVPGSNTRWRKTMTSDGGLLDAVRSRITNPDVFEAHDFSLWTFEMAGLL